MANAVQPPVEIGMKPPFDPRQIAIADGLDHGQRDDAVGFLLLAQDFFSPDCGILFGDRQRTVGQKLAGRFCPGSIASYSRIVMVERRQSSARSTRPATG